MKKTIIVLAFLMACLPAFSQVVYEDISNTGIYEFLDELANLKLITLNSVVKPYSRNYIAGKLVEARDMDAQMRSKTGTPSRRMLNKRQQKELHFYLQDYQLEKEGRQLKIKNYDYKLSFLLKKQSCMVVALNPPGFHYKDSMFTISVRPILGVQWMTNENGTEYHRWWGGSMFGYIGKNFGFYANLRDNNASSAPAEPKYFTLEQGAVYKPGSKKGVDFSEMRGGMVASVSWGSVGIINDRMEWGDNYHGANILSGKAPAFPYIQLHLNPVKWFDFNYIHGWLNSNVIDSSRSYYSGDIYRQIYRNKYIAANMFTFIPWRGLNLSFGNSIIYSDISVNPVYLIPFLFYNSVDATKNNYVDYAGSNSQLFFNFSSRQIRHLNLFISLYIDEWKMSRMMKKDQHNFTSLKAGFRLSDFPLQNVSFTAEYTRTQPMTYDHYLPTTTFASNDYALGNYLRENSQEIYLAISFHPLRGLLINSSYTIARHGDDFPYRIDAGYVNDQVPFLKNITWQNHSFELSARYEFVSNGYFFVRYLNSDREGDTRYQPAVMNGRTNTLMTGINFGF
ncbi:MAG: hypothetical protein NT040_15120 [Bacteroidetes bacterium]|nr:hypothetical protein [Bacteroidota bacterium]